MMLISKTSGKFFRHTLTNLNKRVLIAICISFFVGQTIAQEESQLLNRSAGLLVPTQKEKSWSDEKMLKLLKVTPNERAFELHNQTREKYKLNKLKKSEVELADPGEEILGGKPVRYPSAFDGVITDGTTIVPDAVDNSIDPYFPPIRDQGNSNACAAFTANCMFTYMTGQRREWEIPQLQFSPAFSYSIVNQNDEGSSLDGNLSVLYENGCMLESEFPTNATNLRAWSTNTTAWRNAMNYRLEKVGYMDFLPERDPRCVAQIKQLLANGYILGVGTSMNWSFTTLKNDPNSPYDDAWVGQNVCWAVQNGGVNHAMTIVGFNDNLWVDINGNNVVDPGEKGAFKLANSWGTNWGNRGFIWFSYDALLSASRVSNAPNLNNRILGWNSNKIYWVIARRDYKPKIVAELKISSINGKEFYGAVGIGSSSATQPTYKYYPAVLNVNGSALSFDGTTNNSIGYPVVDLTDLVDNYNINSNTTYGWFVELTDRNVTNPTQLLGFTLIDVQSSNQYQNATGLPLTADRSTVVSRINYKLGPRGSDYAPVILMDSIFYVKKGLTLTVQPTIIEDYFDGHGLNYNWICTGGPGSVSYVGGENGLMTLTFSEAGVYYFQLIVDEFLHIVEKDFKVVVMNSVGYTLPNDNGNGLATPYTYLNGLTVSNGYVYAISPQGHFKVINATNPAAPYTQYTSPWLGNLISGIATYNNHVYFAINGLCAYNVSDKSNPFLASKYENVECSFKTDIIVDGSYLYMSSHFGLYIFSLSNPAQPQLIGEYKSELGVNTICISGNNAFVFGEGYWSVLNISNKSNPYLVKQFNTPYDFFRDAVVVGNSLYLLTRNSMLMYNISNITSPVILGSKDLEAGMTGEQLAVDGNLAYVTSRHTISMQGLYVYDCSVPSKILLIKSFGLQKPTDVCRPHVTINGNYLYCGHDGLYILNKSFPTRKISVNATTINFGSTPVYVPKYSSLVLTNNGNTTLTFKGILNSAPYYIWLESLRPVNIEPGYSYTLNFKFLPTDVTQVKEKIIILSNAADNPAIPVEVEGSGTLNNVVPRIVNPARVSANPVIGTTVNVSALGVDDQSESQLEYYWQTKNYAAGEVTFTPNATNSAKNAVATFSKAGTYTIEVEISDASGYSVRSSVNVTVNSTLSSVSISPKVATVPLNQTLQFSANARDQFGFPLQTQPSFVWGSSSGGTINSSGLFTAGSVARNGDTVRVSTGGRKDSAFVSVVATSDVVYSFSDLNGYQIINGIHGGIDFGTNRWAGGNDLYNLTKCGYFLNQSTSETFRLPAGKVLKSIKVSTNGGCGFTIKDGVNPDVPAYTANQIPNVVYTEWTLPGSVITIQACGGDLRIDDITYCDATDDIVYRLNNFTCYQIINGVYGGIDFGSNKWAGGDDWYGLSKCAYFLSNTSTSETFTIPSGKVLKSMKVSSNSACNLTISDGVNASKTFSIPGQNPITVNTGWNRVASTITVQSPCGKQIKIDDITYGSIKDTLEIEGETSNKTLNGQAIVANLSSASGGKVVGFLGNSSSNWLRLNSINVVGGQYTLTLSYVSGENRTMYIDVNNGASIITLSNLNSGSWSTVKTVTTTVTLNPGLNTLKFYNNSAWAPDVDKIKLARQ